ncbi:MAG: hypothetical protein ABI770_07015 [Sphingomicrobium sp.]
MLKLKVSELRSTVRLGMAALAAAVAAFAMPFALAYSGTTKFETLSDYIGDRQVTRAEKLTKQRHFEPTTRFWQALR